MRQFFARHPFWCLFLPISGMLFLLGLIFSFWESLAEWWSVYPAALFRLALGGVSSVFPFSLFEILLILAALYAVFLLIFTVVLLIRRHRRKSFYRFRVLFLIPLCTLLVVADLFVLTFSASYHRRGVAEHMALDTAKVGEEDLFYSLESLCRILNETAPEIPKNENGESICPYTRRETEEKIRQAADRFGEKHAFYQSAGFPAKAFLTSSLITYTHISGVFGFFTGEANVNTNYPHFIVTATAAHEASHARGIGPENECNFLAFAVLAESDDAYLRYCGALFILDDFISVCKKLDKERTAEILAEADPSYLADFAAYSRFFRPYRDAVAATIADNANSAYLKSQGQKEGTLSYSRIIELCAAYLTDAR